MKKAVAFLPALALILTLFYLPAAAAPSARDMAGLTPYDLTAEPFPGQNGAAMLRFKIDVPNTAMPGMDGSDDIHVKVEYKLGTGTWVLWNSYSSQRMLGNFQVEPGVFRLPFVWALGGEWDGAEPIVCRVYCEYMRGGNMGTGVISGYSKEASISAADGRTSSTRATKPETTSRPRRTTEPKTTSLPEEPVDAGPAEEGSGSFVISRWVFAAGGIVVLLLLLAAATILIVAFKKDKGK